eukprot:2701129-Alexandrium_andersonii.AAC.1
MARLALLGPLSRPDLAWPSLTQPVLSWPGLTRPSQEDPEQRRRDQVELPHASGTPSGGKFSRAA